MCNLRYKISEKWFNGEIVANRDTINNLFK